MLGRRAGFVNRGSQRAARRGAGALPYGRRSKAASRINNNQTESSMATETSSLQPRNSIARRERLFFGGMTIAMFATVIAGFGPSYFFASVVSSPTPLTPLLHVHGAVFTTWMVLLVLQSTLISAGRVDLHR